MWCVCVVGFHGEIAWSDSVLRLRVCVVRLRVCVVRLCDSMVRLRVFMVRLHGVILWCDYMFTW